MGAFLRLGRPIFLLGGFALYGVGATWAWRARGVFHWPAFLWGQATVTAAQLMTHYANDYFDLEADRANLTPTRWSGGSRILVKGLLPPRAAWATALVLGGVALLCGLTAAGRGPSPLVCGALLLPLLTLAWCYSAPPLRLVARGAGELTTALVVTILTPLWAFHLQSAALEPGLLATLPALATLQITMLFAINFPDAAGDRVSGKRTLVVLLGTRRAAAVCRALLVGWMAFLPLLALALHRFLHAPWWVALGPAVSLPFGVWQVVALGGVRRGASRSLAGLAFPGLAFRGVAMLFLAAAATLALVVAFPWPR